MSPVFGNMPAYRATRTIGCNVHGSIEITFNIVNNHIRLMRNNHLNMAAFINTAFGAINI
jgi:hypothetical protein